MKRKKGRRKRRKKESTAKRIGRYINRFFISVTALLIALYLFPYSLRVLGDSDDRAISALPVGGEVQVLNGCGEPGLALKATHFLRANNFDVVEMGNASHFHHKVTKVIARTEDLEPAEQLRSVLGVGEIVSEPDPTLLLDVSVVLGSDCVPFPPERREVGESR